MKTRLQDFYNYIFRQYGAVAAADAKDKQKDPSKKIQSLFSISVISEKDRIAFRAALRELKVPSVEKALFDNTTDKITSSYKIPADDAIFKMLSTFESNHQFFPEEKISAPVFEKFKAFFLVSKIIGDFVEHNNTDDNADAYLHAYKLLIVFGDQDKPEKYFQSIDKYLLMHNFLQLEHPLHDALVGSLPKNISDAKILKQWRTIIYDAGKKGFELFARATDIQNKLIELYPSAEARDAILANYKTAVQFARTITYKKASEYEALADLFMRYSLSEALFDKTLAIDLRRKKVDLLPNVIVDGIEIGFPGYYLTKLPLNLETPVDRVRALAYVLGHLTNCCQSMGGHSEQCVIDGITLSNSGFLVLLRHEMFHRELKKAVTLEPKEAKAAQRIWTEKEINKLVEKCKMVGQGYLWKSRFGNLTVDSWENLHSAADDIAVNMLKQYGEIVCMQKDSTILRVTIGKGGKTPKHKFVNVSIAEEMLEGRQYGDSTRQQLVFINSKMQEAIWLELRDLMRTALKDAQFEGLDLKQHIFSFMQTDLIKTVCANQQFQNYLKVPEQSALFGKKAGYVSLWLLLAALNEAGINDVDNIAFAVAHFDVSYDARSLAKAFQSLAKAGMINTAIFREVYAHPGIWSRLVEEIQPLRAAINSRSHTLLDLFLACGAKVNEIDSNAVTPLRRAVYMYVNSYTDDFQASYFSFIDKLIQAKADPSREVATADPIISVKEGETVLHTAFAYNKHKLIIALLKAGADPNICDEGGEYYLFKIAKSALEGNHADQNIFTFILNSRIDLSLLTRADRKPDLLPDVVVDGSELGFPGYYLAKLPINMELEDRGFLVLLKESAILEEKKAESFSQETDEKSGTPILTDKEINIQKLLEKCKIIGQARFLKTILGNLFIDSWTSCSSMEDGAAFYMLKHYAQDVTRQKGSTILRVTLNVEYLEFKDESARLPKTDLEFDQKTKSVAKAPPQGLLFFNTEKQAQLFHDCRAVVSEISSEDNSLFRKYIDKILFQEQIVSFTQAELIKPLLKNSDFQLYLTKKSDQRVNVLLQAKKNPELWFLLGMLNAVGICTTENIVLTMSKHLRQQATAFIANSVYALRHLTKISHTLYEFILNDTDFQLHLNQGLNPFNAAIKLVNASLVTELSVCGAKINEQNAEGDSFLHVAIESYLWIDDTYGRRLRLFQALIDTRANLESKNYAGKVPLQLACYPLIYTAAVIALLKAGANPNVLNQQNNKPLLFEVAEDRNFNESRKEIFEAFLEAKIDHSITFGEKKNTLLLYLCSLKNSIDVPTLLNLLNHGYDINAQNSDGDTVMHLILKRSPIDVKIVNLLLDHHADMSLKNKEGKTAEDITKEGGVDFSQLIASEKNYHEEHFEWLVSQLKKHLYSISEQGFDTAYETLLSGGRKLWESIDLCWQQREGKSFICFDQAIKHLREFLDVKEQKTKKISLFSHDIRKTNAYDAVYSILNEIDKSTNIYPKSLLEGIVPPAKSQVIIAPFPGAHRLAKNKN